MLKNFWKYGAGIAATWALVGCAGISASLPTSGPNADEISRVQSSTSTVAGIQIVDISDSVARQVRASQQSQLFSETLGAVPVRGFVIGAGDVIEISIWEAPPAALFNAAVVDPRAGASSSRLTALPEQMVNSDGVVNVPFVGSVRAEGRTPQQIEADVTQRLKGKANQPQVLVRLIRNASSNVTLVGDFATSTRMPLTARGERLLDAIAAAGGVKQPVSKTTVQITRGASVQALALETIIQDPRQNVALQAGDVITASYQPLSLTVLGATGKNEEVAFESQGITLAQALARAGGLQDQRADAQGLFIFRFEEPRALGALLPADAPLTAEGKVPVVYRANLRDASMFFTAQNFPIRNRDVLYVSNASAAELQKFLNIIGSVLSPVIGFRAVTR